MGNARKAALTALEKCRRAKAWSDAVLGGVMDAERLDGRDRALAAALCYGVMQNRIFLDHCIAKYSSMKLQKLEPKVLDILRLSAYQLLFMDKIPSSAAVNEAVNLCKSLGYARAGGFVNAVLRKIAADEEIFHLSAGSAREQLSVRYSHPLWLVDYLCEALGAAEAERFLRCSNAPVPITAQVNSFRTDTDALMAELTNSGVKAEAHAYLPQCVTILSAGDLKKLPSFQRGDFYVQDAAAKMAVMAAEPKKSDRILDVCAAPGGKSFAAAILSRGAAITSCDLHENKLKRIRESAQRLGLEDIETVAADGRRNREEWNDEFDVVIADVPCSGLGVLRKKPDIRYQDPAEFENLPAIQLDILRNVSRYVRSGGTLLYSTCTIRREENEALVTRFLAEHNDFETVDFVAADGSASENGMLQLWPQRNDTDGFFIAKLRRK